MKIDLVTVPFEKLDFGETESLDKFCNADVAIVDMSIQMQQSALSYHVGVRESCGMPETILLVHDLNPEFTLSLKVSYFVLMSTKQITYIHSVTDIKSYFRIQSRPQNISICQL